MQTFLLNLSLTKSAESLDRNRLGCQRKEVLQILKALSGESKGWVNHPAVRMWRGYEQYLIVYGVAICDEWMKRGYKDTCQAKIVEYVDDNPILLKPPWLTEEFCSNHRSILLGKARYDIIKYGRDINKLRRSIDTWKWYYEHKWSEKAAVPNEKGQWPYIWPV